MVRTSFLRVYQPVETFAPEDTERWLAEGVPEQPESQVGRAWLVSGRLPGATDGFSAADGAFLRRLEDKLFLCPWRTRLRMLVGLLAFRGTLPEEVADAFVDDDVARRAARELADISDNHPEVRSHILHANWHVPLRWFAAFDPTERILTEDRDGLRVRYETTLFKARERLERAVDILDLSWLDDSVALALRELMEWVCDFPAEGLLELDYGSVAAMFENDELVDDVSAEEVWSCLDALQVGDAERAGRLFEDLSDKWATARAHEAMN
ncbi:MAG: hypothetical protein GEU78_14885 [Actinobacteria bacterium]|nr:hypothetical protein [Actinomycetota bacterium]